jgi:hypothetical protein
VSLGIGASFHLLGRPLKSNGFHTSTTTAAHSTCDKALLRLPHLCNDKLHSKPWYKDATNSSE